MEPIVKNDFIEFLNEGYNKGGFSNDDVIAIGMPLLQEVLTFHEQGMVAPLERLKHILITNDLLDIDENFIQSPKLNFKGLSGLISNESDTFEIVNETKHSIDIDESTIKETNLTIQLDAEKEITKPVYLPGYISYENLIGHHDELTDIFLLGLVLGSLVTGLDMNLEDDFIEFVENRNSLFILNSRIHPAIANIVAEMTELDRKKRARDLHEVIEKLKNYRDYNPEKEIDLTSLEGFKNQDISTRSKWILNKLKSRLFDISRRNRLLYFKNSSKFLNLTVASVPSTLNFRNVDPNSLFYWNAEISSKVKSGKSISLSKYLKFEDNTYIPSVLDKIRSESSRDINEYGFSQLRLIVCSLNWYNLKEDKFEKINSPLLLVPVEVKKKKGVKDQYTLEITGNEAEVNPVLVYWLRELYDIKLPDSVVLEDFEMGKLYQSIQDQIIISNSGISIEYIDKPRIKLIHSIAKQTLSQFNRRLKRNKNLSHYKEVDYSYQRENFQPLGLSIYKQRIEPNASVLEFLINEDITLSTYNLMDNEKERSLFTLADQEDINPYLWEFDTCNVILGNFNYKKMSLVRDYNEVIDENINDPIFEQLFSDQPKEKWKSNENTKLGFKEKYHIISSDPTQSDAIDLAKSGQSYIIQGPPGTGKSQTITNLIADFIARGKRVLFVCEKRAAIDVVFYRLKQQGLDELCCRIHDSQTDKKEFIMNLKETYNDFLKNKFNLKETIAERNRIIDSIEKELNVIEKYNKVVSQEIENVGISLLKLIERLIELKDNHVSTTVDLDEMVPEYGEWSRYGELVHQLSKQLEDLKLEPFISSHPAVLLNNEILKKEHPVNYIRQLTDQLEELFEFIIETLNSSDVPDNLKEHFSIIRELVYDAELFKPFAENGNMYLYDASDPMTGQFEGLVLDYKRLNEDVEQAKLKNINWKNKFSLSDLQSAKLQLSNYQNSIFSFLNPGYWSLKKTIRTSYDFKNHKVKPGLKQVLDELQSEYDLLHQAKDLEKKAELNFKIKSINETWNAIEKFRKERNKPTYSYLGSLKQEDVVFRLSGLKDKIDMAGMLIDESLNSVKEMSIIDLLEEIENIKLSLKTLPEILSMFNDLNEASDAFQSFIKKGRYSPEQFEKLMAQKSLNKVFKSNREFHKTEASDIGRSIIKLNQYFNKLYEINSIYIRATVRQNFNDKVSLSVRSVAGMSQQEREIKKNYTEGRKLLEHEFNKSIRYRSIRDLASRESGLVIQDLKPVWLMSPLSVSDTLPLNPEYFDVVIFDEASQITLEEGIPPLFRAKQTIIVGDEMQMPPSNFFGSVSPEDDDDLLDDDAERMRIDADSLLTQGVRKLQDVMLGWHYRSKFESLISFSNAAFYNRNLLTIPDHVIPSEDLSEIKANSAENALSNIQALHDRSISYHFMEHGVYEKRTNVAEAEYIALLIKTLLDDDRKQSIGVVAFSQEQQNEIENALIRLTANDPDFENRLEEEYQRQEDGQFVGLFVKNLENVQGDERDIIIMSICYGYDHNKRMIMNFGPINRKGGEKRLNVIFSRAKKHMAVISSIKHSDIKNEYNEGANYFKRFLHYAESVSRGELKSASLTLDSLSKNKQMLANSESNSSVVLSIADELKNLGFKVDLNVGQSYFRCSIGVRSNDDEKKYSLGILVDTSEHYSNDNILEQYVLRPQLLKNFNWNVIQVYSKDWLAQKDKVMAQIQKALRGELHDEIPAEIDVMPAFIANEEVNVNESEIKIEDSYAEEKDESGLEFRTLTFKDDTSDKFWKIAQDGMRILVRYGKTGTKGQENVKVFETEEQARKEMEKLIMQKIKKGYQG